jgi:DNA replication and repair protein RecF
VTQPKVWLRRIEIQDFRNLERVSLDVPAEGAAIIGDNGQGKTNFLEAISYLHSLRSVRGARDADLTRFGAAGFHLAAEAQTPEPHRIDLGFELATKKKKLLQDGIAPKRLSDGLGGLPSVIFSPRDADIVAGAASERRRFLDWMLALTSRSYLRALQQYRASLSQRNAALRGGRDAGGEDRVAVWEPSLAESGAVIVSERANWVRGAAQYFRDLCARIGEQGVSAMAYRSAFADSSDLATDLAAELARKRISDLRRGVTSVGPHRDELALTVDGESLRVFGSAGQNRTAAIALRILEASTLRDATGAEPMLLFDDPFAELDAGRAERILELVQESGRGQTILTVPRASDIPKELMRLPRYRMSNGTLTRDAA